ncbi:hypothetical protein CPB84DRAFT_254733 [Gymnopilus junonius]|uniref:Uncharacterized protein n=1 Tax=Gymnopilus junonius TaxID=109634 RepID=A0A9P5NC42_GYMJU|nr:hypothetical protein CPB84DRAFT_254733 [Gymnopilus junonius]
MQKDIQEDIEHNLRNAVQCRFDELLKYFLYLILKEDSKEKDALDKVQDKIEELQWKRHYIYENDGREKKISVNTGLELSIEDSDNGTQEEKGFITSRDDILDGLLRRAFDVVQPIADNTEAKTSLTAFAAAFQSAQTVFYSSYVRLCNDVLDRLRVVAGDLPVRDPDMLDIQFQHDNCYPSVIISSTKALLNAHRNSNPDFTKPPPSKLPWQVTLASMEFDVHKDRYPEGIVTYLECHVFTKDTGNHSSFETSNNQTKDKDELEGDNKMHIKRSRNGAIVEGDEGSLQPRGRVLLLLCLLETKGIHAEALLLGRSLLNRTPQKPRHTASNVRHMH